MKWVIIDSNRVTEKMKLGKKPRTLDNGQTVLRVAPENEELLSECIKRDKSFIKKIPPEISHKYQEKIEDFYQREPFAAKCLKTGEKLFRRKHGYLLTIPANTKSELVITVPYTNCKINKLEVIDANTRDIIDLMILDTAVGSVSGIPNFILNQFGFSVVVSDLLYSDKSDYDADLFAGLQVKIDYTNRTNTEKEVGINIIFHEVK